MKQNICTGYQQQKEELEMGERMDEGNKWEDNGGGKMESGQTIRGEYVKVMKL